QPIFGDVYDEERVDFRLQATLPTFEAIHHQLVNLLRINDAWHVDEANWHALRSLPGGRDQAVHRDFPTFETACVLLTRKLVQASVIIALMDNTFIHVYLGCFGGQVDRSRRRTIQL
ncbi:hypothetical protein PHYSODRAFT_435081, partial [Phytophthora sojae]